MCLMHGECGGGGQPAGVAAHDLHDGDVLGAVDGGVTVFDGSLLQAFAENGTEVMYCATLLFLGYVDDATTFAEGHEIGRAHV